jgi:hypothetical protein
VLTHATKDENKVRSSAIYCAWDGDESPDYKPIFLGIAHVLSHARKDENGSPAGRLCHFIFKGGNEL